MYTFCPVARQTPSPIIINNATLARPAGRIAVHNGQLFRCSQDCSSLYGKRVYGIRITELTPTRYHEDHANAQFVLGPAGQGWNAAGMHQIDAHRLPSGQWLACVDGNYITDW